MNILEFFTKDITTVFVILLLIFFLFFLIFLVVKFLAPMPVSEEESEEIVTEDMTESVVSSGDVTVVETYLKDIASTLDELKTKVDTLVKKSTTQQDLSEEIKTINSKLDTIYRILSDISEG